MKMAMGPFFRRAFSTNKCKFTGGGGVTLSRQGDLLRLGVPKLEDSAAKFVKVARPFLSQDELATTAKLAEDLCAEGGKGHKLQKLLEERASLKDNWLSDWWLEMAYMRQRAPILIKSSPGICWPKQEFHSTDEFLSFASKVVSASLDFHGILKRQEYPIDTAGKDPMEMEQYYKMFGTCRIPAEKKDYLKYSPDSKHIVIVHKHRYFKLQVYDEKNGVASEEQILAALRFLTATWPNVTENRRKPNPPLGALTATGRDAWARAYQRLYPDNKETFECIQSALFAFCLDGVVSNDFPNQEGTQFAGSAAHALHGHGDYANRWLDKTLNIYVARSGENGLIVEHAPVEALPASKLSDHVLHSIHWGEKPNLHSPTLEEAPKPHFLPFAVDPESAGVIETAKKDVEARIADVSTAAFTLTGFGKRFMKQHKFSPDSFCQMALQLAFYRMHQGPGAGYETGTLRRYKFGRTDIIRSCSLESIEFARLMLADSGSLDKRMEAMRKAVNGHSAFTKMVMNGGGFDRHFLGLIMSAKEHNLDLPDIFLDASFKRSAHYRISTSQVSGNHAQCTVLGPMVDDGYGLFYNIRDDDLHFSVVDKKSNPESSALEYAAAIEKSLEEMHALIEVVDQANNKH